MSTVFNPFLIAKMLDRAGHPGTSQAEAFIALRKAYAHSSSRGKTFSDIAHFIDGDICLEAAKMRHAELLSQIAELTLARDDAEARARAQAGTIVDLERARIKDSLIIDGLRLEITAVGEKLDSPATPVVSVESVPAVIDEVVSVDGSATEALQTAGCGSDDRVDHARPSEPFEAEPVMSAHTDAGSPQQSGDDIRFTWAEYARFSQLATLGRARSSIARTLSREFGGRFSRDRVAEMLRQRWLSPAYLRLIGVGALTA